MQAILSLTLILALSSAAYAQKPLAVITGPSAGAVGDFLELDSSESVADHAAWTVLPAELSDGRMSHRVYNNGRTLLVASVPGRYVVILAVSNADGIDVRQHVVTVTGKLPDNPNPGPVDPVEPIDPVDPVTPEPTFPDGKFKLASKCYSWAKPLRDKSTAQKLAANLRTVISRGEAGGYSGPEQLVQDTAQRNEQGIAAATLDRWEPWFAALEAELDTLGDSGALRSTQDYLTAWDELATGLEAVK